MPDSTEKKTAAPGVVGLNTDTTADIPASGFCPFYKKDKACALSAGSRGTPALWTCGGRACRVVSIDPIKVVRPESRPEVEYSTRVNVNEEDGTCNWFAHIRFPNGVLVHVNDEGFARRVQ